jgi:hypothetical protein
MPRGPESDRAGGALDWGSEEAASLVESFSVEAALMRTLDSITLFGTTIQLPFVDCRRVYPSVKRFTLPVSSFPDGVRTVRTSSISNGR